VEFSRKFGELDDVKPYINKDRPLRFPYYELFDAGNVDYNGEIRDGDNLYAASLIALDAATGNVLWKVYTGDNSATGGHYNWSSPLIYNGDADVGVVGGAGVALAEGLPGTDPDAGLSDPLGRIGVGHPGEACPAHMMSCSDSCIEQNGAKPRYCRIV